MSHLQLISSEWPDVLDDSGALRELLELQPERRAARERITYTRVLGLHNTWIWVWSVETPNEASVGVADTREAAEAASDAALETIQTRGFGTPNGTRAALRVISGVADTTRENA